MGKKELPISSEEYEEVLDALSYSAQLLSASAQDVQSLGVTAKKEVTTKMLRQVDAINAVIRQLLRCH